MRIIDAHCHLESEEFAGALDSVLRDAHAAGVVKLITASITPEQWPASRAIAEAHPEVAFTWGVHPWYLKEEYLNLLDGLRKARRQGAVAIGEIGLDGKVENPPMDLQRIFFETQLRIAKDLELPVVMHCRGAFNELLETLKRLGAPSRGGLIHAFSGSVEVAEACLKHGLRFSMGGTLTYHKSRKRERVLQRIYPEAFLLETDSPDIPPVQAAPGPNVPANILHCLRGAAAYLGIPEEAIAEQTTRNAVELFGLDLAG